MQFAYLRGFVVGIANPKDLLFFVAFFPRFVGITPDSRVSLAILAALWIAVDFTVLTATWPRSTIRRFIGSGDGS
ncbi:hypothetical protein [Burkholderia sp. NRF60-BP8]|uniref:hypothetical protein n=1 Tax=Burkholderia sp. NRF60-BP8 TaxID=1637853 RepID=UPI001F4472CD|nr:hypothetical protein [Burkholderia sp. NRF60-BP8]